MSTISVIKSVFIVSSFMKWHQVMAPQQNTHPSSRSTEFNLLTLDELQANDFFEEARLLNRNTAIADQLKCKSVKFIIMKIGRMADWLNDAECVRYCQGEIDEMTTPDFPNRLGFVDCRMTPLVCTNVRGSVSHETSMFPEFSHHGRLARLRDRFRRYCQRLPSIAQNLYRLGRIARGVGEKDGWIAASESEFCVADATLEDEPSQTSHPHEQFSTGRQCECLAIVYYPSVLHTEQSNIIQQAASRNFMRLLPHCSPFWFVPGQLIDEWQLVGIHPDHETFSCPESATCQCPPSTEMQIAL